MKRLIITASLLVSSSASIAFADDTDNHQLAIGSNTRALRSDSANALTTQSLEGGQLTYAYRLPVEVFPRLAVWAETGIAWGGATGQMFKTIDTEIDTFDLSIGGRARYSLHSRVAVSAKFALGTSHESLKISDGMEHTASSSGWGGTTAVAGAIEMLAVDNEYVGIGLRFEIGYTVASKVEMTTTPDRPDDGTIKLPMQDAAFGGLDLGGPSLGFGLVGRF